MTDIRMKSSSENESPKRCEERKKTYSKPSFRSEEVFETMALSCGKTAQLHCGGRFGHQLKQS